MSDKTQTKEIEKVEETKAEKPKKHRNLGYKIIIVLLLLTLVAGAGVWAYTTGKLDFIFNPTPAEEEKVELKHTDTITAKTDGVYITDVSEVVDEVMPSIVAITSKTVINSGLFDFFFFGTNTPKSYTTEGAGSGVIVAEDDENLYILTNNHVVKDASELSVQFIDDTSHDASIKGVSKRKDIAIVSVSKSGIENETLKKIKIATLGDSNKLKVGNGVIAIGNALGYGQSVTIGVVSALNREITTEDYTQEMIQTDAAINGGNSGGALLNSKGEVVGINSVKYSQNGTITSASIEGMGFAIPISDVAELIASLIKGEDDKELTLGIEGYMTNSGNIANYKLPEGLYVSAITAGGNAEKSELEIGNIITEIEGNKVTSLDSVRKALNKKQHGGTVTLKVKYASRNEYKEKEIIVTLQ
ncbi:MAG: trypsin-like peptidase domain-containing protein [Candidatus Saccharibacteria bacterium]|nr:trypsin-like peptidase domain-containing protein [Candidatus Saccharibacteria bacterium]